MTTTPRPSRYSLRELSLMRATQLERITSSSFTALTSTAIADATGDVAPDVAGWLRSEEICQDWHDALVCAVGELRTASERMRYLQDPRIKTLNKQMNAVRYTLRNEAVPLLRRMRRLEHEREKENYGAWDADKFVRKILGAHFPEESSRLLSDERRRRGLRTVRPPVDECEMEDKADLVEALYWHGVLHTPESPELQKLRDMSFDGFRNQVATDCRDQDQRNGYLRHPLALARWEEALASLAEMTSGAALAHPEHHTLEDLPAGFARDLTHEEVMKILNARRFLSAVHQRQTEVRLCWRHLHAYSHKPLLAHRQPWRDAAGAAQKRLALAHPKEYAWVRGWVRAVLQHGQAGDQIARDVTGRTRRDLRQQLERGLADGTWRNAPPPA